MAELTVADFQLTCRRRTFFLFSPKPRWLPPILEWVVSWTFPSRGLGTLLSSMHFRGGQPPTRFLADHLIQLGQIPMSKSGTLPKQTIAFDGRLLIHFLAPALDHLSTQGGHHGTWAHHPKAGSVPGPAPETMGTPLDDPPSPLASPLLPQTLRFIPNAIHKPVNEAWHAVHYDSDQRSLVCRKFVDGGWEFGKFRLPAPLYQLFPHLSFQNHARQLVVRNRLVTLADAILFPDNHPTAKSG